MDYLISNDNQERILTIENNFTFPICLFNCQQQQKDIWGKNSNISLIKKFLRVNES